MGGIIPNVIIVLSCFKFDMKGVVQHSWYKRKDLSSRNTQRNISTLVRS